MKYIISESTLQKVVNLFFKNEFQNTVLKVADNSGEDWFGFWTPNGVLIVGTPYSDENDDGNWYFNGNYFDDQWKVFGLDGYDFGRYMRKYLNSEYNLRINRIV